MLVGNSVTAEIASCLEPVLRRHGASVVSVYGAGILMCQYPDLVREQLAKPASKRPNTVIFFTVPLYRGCSTTGNEHAQIKQLLALFDKAGVTHTYLAPFVPPPGVATSSSPINLNGKRYRRVLIDVAATSARIEKFFRSLAAKHPERLDVIDAGRFMHDDAGIYQWRMPCVSGRELGCDTKGTLVVRWPRDGIHFCADPHWTGGTCTEMERGGERRVAAAIAEQVLASPPTAARSSP